MVGEGFVTPMIMKVADQYVEGLDARQLELNLSSGIAVLNNVDLKRSAIDALDLPFHLHRGVCRQIKIVLPGIMSMVSKPWRIEIDQLLLNCVCPLEQPFDEEEERSRIHRAKMALVEAFEQKRRERLAAKDTSDKNNSTFVSRQVEVITNNAIVEVKAVHFRYESRLNKTVFGAVLSDVHAHTTDDSGRDSFLDPSKADRVIKGIKFEGLRVYCQSGAAAEGAAAKTAPALLLDAKNKAEWLKGMRIPFDSKGADAAATTSSDASAQTIFGPVVGSASLTMMFKAFVKKALSTPYVHLKVALDNLVAFLTREQYVGALATFSQWSNWCLVMPFRRYRPSVPVRGNAQKWWRYAFHAINRGRVEAWKASISPNFRPLYMDAFDSKLQRHNSTGRKGLSDEEVAAYNEKRVAAIERMMTAKDIVECRREVYKNVSDTLKDLIAKREKAARNAGWFSGWSKSKEQQQEEKLIEELQSSWGIVPDEEHALDVELEKLPPSYCNLDARLHLPSVGVTLVMDDQPKPCDIRLHHTTVAVKQFNAPQSMQVRASAQDLTMTNPTTSHAYIPFVVSKQVQLGSTSRQRSELSAPEPLLDVSVLTNPVTQPIPGTKLDAQAHVTLQPLRVIADPPLLRCLGKFFEVPVGIDVSGISNSTSQVAAAVSNMASAHAASAISGSKTVDVCVDMGAPIIILPKTFAAADQHTDAMCVSLGRFKFSTHPLTEDAKRQRIEDAAKDEGGERGTSASAKKLDLYYHNTATFTDLFVNSTTMGDAQRDVHSGFSLVPSIQCTADIFTRMIPTDVTNEIAVVKAHVPTMAVRLSVHQTFILSSMLDTWGAGAEQATSQQGVEGSVLEKSAAVGHIDAMEKSAFVGRATAGDADVQKLIEELDDDAVDDPDGGSARGASPAATPTTPGDARRGEGSTTVENNPLVLVNLGVGEFGLLIFDDDAETKRPLPTHRFKFAGGPLDVEHHARQLSATTAVTLQSLACLDMKQAPAAAARSDKAVGEGEQGLHIISGEPQLHCVICSAAAAAAEPMSVQVTLARKAIVHVGTPLAEMLETVMDIVNLFAQAKPSDGGAAAAAETGAPPPVTRKIGDSVAITPEEKDATGSDAVTMTLTLKVEHAGISLYDPRQVGASGELVDVLLAEGTVGGISLGVNLRKTTMDVSGGVKSVDLTYHKLPVQLLGKQRTEESTIRVISGSGSSDTQNLVTFSYITTTPAAPVPVAGAGKPLDRTRPLDFTNFVKVALQPADVVYDAYTVMVLLDYFTVGFISRFAALGARKRYDGREIFLPPPGPQMLTSLDITVASPTVKLPLNDGTNTVMAAKIRTLRIANALEDPKEAHAENGQIIGDNKRAMLVNRILLDGLELVDTSRGEEQMLIQPTSLTLSIVSSLDASLRVAPSVTVGLEDLAVTVDPETYISMLQLLCGNILNMPVSDKKSPEASGTSSDSGDSPPGQTFIESKSISFVCHKGKTGELSAAPFSISLEQLVVGMVGPDITVKWSTIAVSIDAEATTGILFECAAASIGISKADAALMAIDVDFGVRRLAVTNQWFDVVDWLVTPSSLAALGPLLGTPSDDGSSAGPSSTKADEVRKEKASFVGTKVSVVSREFVIPLLNDKNEEVFCAALSTLKFSYTQLSAATYDVTVDLESFELSHVATGLGMLEYENATDASDRGLLGIVVGGDTVRKSMSIDVTLSGLNFTLVMPLLQELIHYATHPSQPPARLPALAMTKDRREAAIEQQKETNPEDRTTTKVRVKWTNPTITVPLDGRFDASNIATPWSERPSLRADLGVIDTGVVLDGPTGGMDVTVCMEKATVADLLEETAMSLTYKAPPKGAQPSMTLEVAPVGVVVSHSSLKRLMGVLDGNIALPPPAHTVTASVEASVSTSNAAGGMAMEIAVEMARLKLFDASSFMFLELCVERVALAQNGAVTTLSVMQLRGFDPTSKGDFLRSGTAAAGEKASSSSSRPSVAVKSDNVAKSMDVELDNTTFTLLPDTIGRLIDLLLSPLGTAADTTADAAAERVEGDVPATVGGDEKPFVTSISIRQSRFDVMRGEVLLAELLLDDSSVKLVSNPDGSSETTVLVGPITLTDRFSEGTIYPEVIRNTNEAGGDVKHFVTLHIRNEPPQAIVAQQQQEVPRAQFTQFIEAKISSLSFIYVPALIQELAAAGAEAGERISNSKKAKERAASTADALMNEALCLKHLDVTMNRPKIVLVADIKSTDTIELFPGSFTLRTSIEDVDAGGKSVQSQLYTVSIAGMQIDVLGTKSFENSQPLEVKSRFFLRPEGGTDVVVNVPALSLKLSESQLIYLFKFGAAITKGSAAQEQSVAVPCGQASIEGSSVPASAPSPSSTSQVQSATSAAPIESAGMAVFVTLGVADVFVGGEKFAIQLRDAIITHKSSAAAGQKTSIRLNSFSLSHVNTELVGLRVVDVSQNASQESTEIQGTITESAARLTPEALRSFMQLVYQPMCVHLLQLNMKRCARLTLSDEPRVLLSENLEIDVDNFLHVTNSSLSTFELDLGGHELLLSGSPAPMIVLEEHTMVVIKNGTIVYNGAYALSSFVHYSVNSVLHVTDSCHVEKRLFKAGVPIAVPRTSSKNTEVPPAKVSVHTDPVVAASEAQQQQRTLVVKLSFAMTVELLRDGDETTEIGFVLGGDVSFMQSLLGTKLERQTFALQLKTFHTIDALLLRPTTVEITGFGDETTHMEVYIPSFEASIRVARIKRILRTINELTAALATKADDKLSSNEGAAEVAEQQARYTTVVSYENENAEQLFVSLKAGSCRHCGARAFLSPTSEATPGVLCYSCGLNKSNINFPSVSAKVGLVDVLMIGVEGEMIELIANNTTFAVDADNKVASKSIVELMVYNRKYAVWEPIVEPSHFELSGDATANDWKVHSRRMFLVPSVFALKLLQSIAGQLEMSGAMPSLIPVTVFNFTGEPIRIDGKHEVVPEGKIDAEVDHLKRAISLAHKDYVVDVALDSTSFVASAECVAEVDVKRERTTVRVMPFHSASGIVRVISEVAVTLQLDGGHDIKPQSTYYLPPSVSLDNPFLIQPVQVVDDDFMPSDPGSGAQVPTMLDILRGGTAYHLKCESTRRKGTAMHFRPMGRNDGSACGIPIFSVVVTGALVAHNITPCTLSLTLTSARTGDELTTVVLEAGEKTPLFHGADVNHYKFTLEVAQGSSVYSSALFSISDSLETVPLRNDKRAVMLLQVGSSNGVLAFSAPFAIANHSLLPLTCHEVSKRSTTSPTNFAELEGQANYWVPVMPHDDPDELLVHFGFSKFRTEREVPLHVLDQVNIVELRDPDSRDTMQLCCRTVLNSLGTRVVTITPRWVIANRTSRKLYVAQDAPKPLNSMPIEAGVAHHFYPAHLFAFPGSEGKVLLRQFRMVVSQDGIAAEPGKSFPIDTHCDTHCVARSSDPQQGPVTISVTVCPQDSYIYIVLEEPLQPPYMFSNRTGIDVKLVEKRTSMELCTVPALSHRPFPLVPAAKNASENHEDVIEVHAEEIGVVIPILLHADAPDKAGDHNLRACRSTGTNGQTIVMLYNQPARTTSTVLPPARQSRSFAASIDELSISVVNHPIEVLHVVLAGMSLRVARTGAREDIEFKIQNYQIDNQTEELPPFPCALCPIRSQKSKGPSIALHLKRAILPANGVLVIHHVSVSLDEIALRVSDGLLVRLFQLVRAVSEAPDPPRRCPTEAELLRLAPSQIGLLASFVRVDEMVINPIFVRLWFQREADVDFIVETMAQSKMLSLCAMSVNDVKITVPGVAQAAQHSRVSTLINKLTDMYVTKIVNGAGAVVLQYAGAIPLIGAPIKAVTDIGSGAIHFFTDPIEGLTESPEAFAKGVARGTTHLVGGVVGGAFGAISNLTGTVARGADMVQGTHKKTGRPAERTNLLTGVGKGLVGIFTKPFEGYAEQGAGGLVKGIGKGLVGVVASPLGGLMSDVATVTGAVADLASRDHVKQAERVRPVRLFHASGGVARFGTLLQTFEFNRRYHGTKWTRSMLETKDGPAWNPKTKEALATQQKISDPQWLVDKVSSNFEGWQYSDDYYGPFHLMPLSGDLMRRRRWVLVAKDRTPSNIIPEALRIVLLAPEGSPTTASFASASPSSSQSSASPSFAARGSLGVSAPQEQSTRVVETYENQRWFPIRGWTSSLLPTDRARWSTRDGRGRAQPKDSFALDEGWTWSDEWKVVGGDADGWEYAVDFPHHFVAQNKTGYCVRRRCWRRTMRKKPQ